jgi:hypothetical protein
MRHSRIRNYRRLTESDYELSFEDIADLVGEMIRNANEDDYYTGYIRFISTDIERQFNKLGFEFKSRRISNNSIILSKPVSESEWRDVIVSERLKKDGDGWYSDSSTGLCLRYTKEGYVEVGCDDSGYVVDIDVHKCWKAIARELNGIVADEAGEYEGSYDYGDNPAFFCIYFDHMDDFENEALRYMTLSSRFIKDLKTVRGYF